MVKSVFKTFRRFCQQTSKYSQQLDYRDFYNSCLSSLIKDVKSNGIFVSFFPNLHQKCVRPAFFRSHIERAKEILSKNISKEKLPEIYKSLIWQLYYRAAEKGEDDKAMGFIEQLNDQMRFKALINFAVLIQRRTPVENQKAISLLNSASKMLPAKISTRQEFLNLGELAAAYAIVEPRTGFRLLEKLVKKYIEIAEFSAVVDSFRVSNYIRKNEFLIDGNNGGIHKFSVSLNNFTKTDFEKTIKIIVTIQVPLNRSINC